MNKDKISRRQLLELGAAATVGAIVSTIEQPSSHATANTFAQPALSGLAADYDQYDGLGLAARKHFHDALDVHDVIAARRTELANDKRLSDVGRAEKLRETAAAEASRVTKAQRALATARDKVRDGRKALTPTVKDRGDIAAAMLRQLAQALVRGVPEALVHVFPLDRGRGRERIR